MTALDEQLISQLQTVYLSDYANGPATLYFGQQPAYHFRMNLSYYFPGEITATILNKSTLIAQALISEIFGASTEIFTFEYLYQKKSLRKWLPKTKLHTETFRPLQFETGTLRTTSFSLTTPPALLFKLARALIYQDFKAFDATILHLEHPLIFFEPNRKILLHIYDDRGCDVFCQTQQDYQTLLSKFGKYVDSYTSTMQTGGFMVEETKFGLRFKK
ncbi:DUF3885 domain-containing protein [Enterococcus sp. LJL120]